MTMAANRALEDCLRLAAGVAPGLRGEAVPPGGLAPASDASLHIRPAPAGGNRAALDAMTAYWSNHWPEAGRAYCALRCWGLLIWQPVYASVIGVHLAGCALSLARVEQRIDAGVTRLFRVPDHAPVQREPDALIDVAAGEISAFCAQTFDDLACVMRVNPVAARGMQADCVLAALLAVRTRRPDWSHAQIDAMGRRWLAALHLEGESAYFAFERRDGAQALALDRKTCCHHYRRRDGDLCSTCPKRDRRERIACLDAEHDCAARD